MVSKAFGTTLVPFDFDGNGSTDVFFERPTFDGAENSFDGNEYAVWTTGPQGVIGQAVIGKNAPEWSAPVLADFDGNGTTDLGFKRSAGTGTVADPFRTEFAVWTLNGTQVTGQAIIGSVTDASGLGLLNVLADFDGNGSADLLFNRFTGPFAEADPFMTQYTVWTTNGTGLLSQAMIGSTTSDWFINTVADFDGNGTSDLLFERSTGEGTEADPDRTEFAVWTLNGTQVTGQAVIGSVTNDSGYLFQDLANFGGNGFADFDGNGSADLLFERFVDAPGANPVEYAVWTTNGTSLLSQAVIGSTSPDWFINTIADFDGNGTSDLLFDRITGTDTEADPNRTEFAVWTLNGTQVTGQAIIGSVTDASGWVLDKDHSNDFNGDGATDLLFSRSASGGGTEFAVWLLNGAGVLAQKAIGTAGADFDFAGSADYNGDGIADLGFVNFETKDLGLWTLGADGSVTSQSIVGTFDNPADLAGWFPSEGVSLNFVS